MDFAAASTDVVEECEKQELEHTLVLVSGHGQGFQEAVGELDQPIAVVGQNEVFFLTPRPLGRKNILEQILPLLSQIGRRS